MAWKDKQLKIHEGHNKYFNNVEDYSSGKVRFIESVLFS